ncbi:MAG: biotin--[acetyl-CoA-carboxylase] ligase [Coleofasciculaceae cyanobacterium SM2_3_26]|nr:biotin--[acetyl-CoA-carboxylase] ligase [Coleofasciculaceae cyanobacterium SM2_3_26]
MAEAVWYQNSSSGTLTVAFDRLYVEHLLNERASGHFPSLIFQLHVFASLASTNQTLWEMSSEMERPTPEGTVVIAMQQTAGRGQWGRQWQSNAGGLYFSLMLTPRILPAESGQLTLLSAWGIARSLRSLGIPIWIKWPNDLVLERRKLGGILCETRIRDGVVAQAVLGVGINWNNAVPDPGIALASFWQEDSRRAIASLEHLAAVVLQGIATSYGQWQRQGMASILADYQSLLMHLGRTVNIDCHSGITIPGVTVPSVTVPSVTVPSVTVPGVTIPGVIVGVDRFGMLRVRLTASEAMGASSMPIEEISLPPGRSPWVILNHS